MKNVIKVIIVFIIIEVVLGYVYYLNESAKMTGNYISSTIRVIDSLVPEKELETQTQTQQKLGAQTQQELETQELCNDEYNVNREIKIAGMNFYRREIKLQTNIDFLNTPDISSKYVIFIAGNSEAYGFYQDNQKRIHTLLQEKMQNKFNSNDFIVLNISDFGYHLHDQFMSVKFFSKIYNPDLVIFYTGGNETRMKEYYKAMLNRQLSLHDNEYWYEVSNQDPWSNDGHIFQECLDKKTFLTVSNFQEDHASFDISRYINDGFFEIKKYFDENDGFFNIDKQYDENDSDFIFYIHPFNTVSIKSQTTEHPMARQLLELQEIEISDNRFINLSNEKFNLDFRDEFHTRDSNIMADKILEDILIKHEKQIISKIN